MEFPFDINNLFGDEISVVDSRLMPSRRPASVSLAECKEQMRRVLDQMGAASTKAQGLYKIITSGRKLETSLDQQLYVMKDDEANNGRGAVLGILKVGRRTLFVYDNNGMQHEMKPLCVLDFYVHESRQRMGCGRVLFDHMLQQEEIIPPHLAVDTPSSQFLPFLKKHYNLKAQIPQVNKFVVFEGFFRNRHDVIRRQGRVVSKPPKNPTSAKARPNDQSSYLEDMKVQLEKEALSHINLPRSRSRDALNPISIPTPPHTGTKEPISQPLPSERRNMTIDTTKLKSQNLKAESTPPLLRRDGPSTDYKEFQKHLNSHQVTQDRRGHLRTGTTSAPPSGQNSSPSHVRSDPLSLKPVGDHYSTRSAKPITLHSNWNVFGAPPSYQGRKWQHTQLW